MKVHFKVILLILSTFALANCERRIQRMTVNNQMWTYVYREVETSFTDTVTWCESLGGKLPSIHSEEDIDWIAKAVGRTSPMSNWKGVWLGMKRKLVNGRCQLDEWMDGTPYDYQLSWYRPCEDDMNIDAAMVMWLDRDFPKVYIRPVTYSQRSDIYSVCVLKSPATLSEKRIHRTVSGNQLWTYVYREGAVDNFDSTINWCDSLGGKLPSVHSQEDIDWIAKAVRRTSPISGGVWLGMRRKIVNGKCQLDEWMDGTPYDYQLSWRLPCEDDVNIDGAMGMWLDGDFPKVDTRLVTYTRRSVCVLKYPAPSVPEQINQIKAMVESMNNSIQMQINRVNETVNEVKQEIPKELNTTVNEVKQDTKKLLDQMSEMKSQMNYIINYLFDGRIQAKSNIIAMKNVIENLKRETALED